MTNPPDSNQNPNERYVPSLTVDIPETSQVQSGQPGGVSPVPTPHVSTNVFVARVPPSWTKETLVEHFKCFGEILSAKVEPSRHFGFVMFKKAESAHAAINAMHDTRPEPNSPVTLHVSIAMHDESIDDLPNPRLFVRGLPQWTTKEHLEKSFSPFGLVRKTEVLVNPQGQCKGSGFVQFSTTEEAKSAISSAASIKIDNWEGELEIKYSETAEARKLRQERNRQRHRWWNNSLVHTGTPASPGRTSPLMYSVPSTTSPCVVYHLYPTPQVSATPSPIQPLTSSLPTANVPSVYIVPAPPQLGDLIFIAPNISTVTVGALLQQFGPVEKIFSIGQNDTLAARMVNTSIHPIIAQRLNGSFLLTGGHLTVGLWSKGAPGGLEQGLSTDGF